MKKLLVLTVVSSLLFFACFLLDGDSGKNGKFWAQDLTNDTFYKIDAQLLAENELCYVWAENGSGVSEATAQRVADEYKNNIYNKMINTFGYIINVKDDYGNVEKKNTIQYIHCLATGSLEDGKLTILLLDIKDGYKKGVNDSYVAGYFWAGNLIEDGNPGLSGQRSNECDMIYIDTFPGEPGSKDSNETLAHELQHLMNFAGSALRGNLTDTWIDEGLSVTAEWVYSGGHSDTRLDWYNDKANIKGLIDKGNNFFMWGNREKENQYAVLDDYSTVYLFFQWLRLQSNSRIYRDISMSRDYDYKAVVGAFQSITSTYTDWETMLQDWLAANYYRSSSGSYGYRSDAELNGIKVHYAPGGGTNISLYPGEGVYSNVTGSSYTIPTSTGNLKYAGLSGSSPITSGSISSGGALLTYNVDTDIDEGKRISGTITGNAPPANIVFEPFGSRSIGVNYGPYPISAGDMLRRKGKNNAVFSGGLNFKIQDAKRGIIVNE